MYQIQTHQEGQDYWMEEEMLPLEEDQVLCQEKIHQEVLFLEEEDFLWKMEVQEVLQEAQKGYQVCPIQEDQIL